MSVAHTGNNRVIVWAQVLRLMETNFIRHIFHKFRPDKREAISYIGSVLATSHENWLKELLM